MRNTGAKIFAALLCGLMLCAQALAQTDAAALVGTWQAKGAEGQAVVVKLNADGTGSLNDAPFSYAVRGDKLVVTVGAMTTPYDFKLQGGVLTVNVDGRVYNLERVGAPAEETARAGASARGANEQSSAPARNPLVGRWLSDEDTLNVREDGTLYLSGMKMSYRIEGNVVIVVTDRGDMSIPFRVDGADKFTVTVEGREIVYHREKEGPGGVGGGGSSSREGAGANPPELVGKWCYMSNVNNYSGGRMSNRCFTLNADGTYEYYGETSSSGPAASSASQESDAGTWTATATTITPRSSKTGAKTYRLERRNHPKNGDPMLVLDGDAYVTFHKRDPWP
jgi:hypothetical protein